MHQAIDHWKSVRNIIKARLQPFESLPLIGKMIFGLHSHWDLLINQPVWTANLLTNTSITLSNPSQYCICIAYLCKWVFSFKYWSLLLIPSDLIESDLLTFNKSSLPLLASCWELVFLKSLDKSVRMSLCLFIVCNIAAPDTGCSAISSFICVN